MLGVRALAALPSALPLRSAGLAVPHSSVEVGVLGRELVPTFAVPLRLTTATRMLGGTDNLKVTWVLACTMLARWASAALSGRPRLRVTDVIDLEAFRDRTVRELIRDNMCVARDDVALGEPSVALLGEKRGPRPACLVSFGLIDVRPEPLLHRRRLPQRIAVSAQALPVHSTQCLRVRGVVASVDGARSALVPVGTDRSVQRLSSEASLVMDRAHARLGDAPSTVGDRAHTRCRDARFDRTLKVSSTLACAPALVVRVAHRACAHRAVAVANAACHVWHIATVPKRADT